MPALKSGSQSGGESANRGGSIRAFARRIGVSDAAIRKAKAAGRFRDSIGKDGNFVDFEVAEREWFATSRTSVGVRSEVRTAAPIGSQSGSQSTAAAAAAAPLPPATPARADRAAADDDDQTFEASEDGQGKLIFATTLIDAQTAATNERARKLKFENDVTEGRLIPVDRVMKEAFEAERIIRENILNLSARIAGELHAERDPQRFRIKFDAALRDALHLTADTLEATANG